MFAEWRRKFVFAAATLRGFEFKLVPHLVVIQMIVHNVIHAAANTHKHTNVWIYAYNKREKTKQNKNQINEKSFSFGQKWSENYICHLYE